MAPDRLGKYRDTLHCARSMLAEEGARGFTRGLESAMWRNTVWNASYFGGIATIKSLLWTPKTRTQVFLFFLCREFLLPHRPAPSPWAPPLRFFFVFLWVQI